MPIVDMFSDILYLLLFSCASEALAELMVDSKFSEKLFRGPWKRWIYPTDAPPPDTLLQHVKVFIDDLWNCGYCTSVWTSGFLALFIPVRWPIYWPLNWIIITLIIHRFANWLHMVYELIRRGRVRTYDLMVKMIEDGEQSDE